MKTCTRCKAEKPLAGKWQGKLFRPVIDWLFSLVRHNHCQERFETERLQSLQETCP